MFGLCGYQKVCDKTLGARNMKLEMLGWADVKSVRPSVMVMGFPNSNFNACSETETYYWIPSIILMIAFYE